LRSGSSPAARLPRRRNTTSRTIGRSTTQAGGLRVAFSRSQNDLRNGVFFYFDLSPATLLEGSTDPMYLAAHTSTTNLRLYGWADNSKNVGFTRSHGGASVR